MTDTRFIVSRFDPVSKGIGELTPIHIFDEWNDVYPRLFGYFIHTKGTTPVYTVQVTDDPVLIEQTQKRIDTRRLYKVLNELSRIAQEDGDYE